MTDTEAVEILGNLEVTLIREWASTTDLLVQSEITEVLRELYAIRKRLHDRIVSSPS